MNRNPETRQRTASLRMLALRIPAILLALMLPLPTPAQTAAVELSPRLPASAISFQPEARPPGLVTSNDDAPATDHVHPPVLVFATGQREPESPGYFSIKDPCAPENLNRNDEPLSQRVDCTGLGVPSGWFPAQNRGGSGR